MSSTLRSELLRLLREDEEFRLQVLGLLGITEITSTLKRLSESIDKLVKEIEKLWEENHRIWEEIKALKESQEKLWEEIHKIWQELQVLREDQKKLWEENHKIWQEIRALREGQEKMWREIRAIRRDLDSVKRAVETLSLSLEEEANEFVQYYLRQRGVSLKTEPVVINKYEFDIYGTNGFVTIVGEVKTRVGSRVVKRISERIDEASKRYPERFPGRVIKVIYCLRISPEALEEANKLGIWIIESGREKNQLII